MRSTDGLVDTGRVLVAAAREEGLTTMAAGLAYHAFNALIPAVLLAFAAMATFGELADVSQVIGAGTATDPGAIRGQLKRFGGDSGSQLRAVVIAGLIFLWSSGRLFDSIRSGFVEVYGADGKVTRARHLAEVAIAFVTVTVALFVVTALGFALSNVLSGAILWVLTPVLLVGVLFVVFLPMYYLFPHPRVDVREAVPGAAFAAIAWALSGLGFRIYATTSQSVQLYGVVGGLMLLLTWLYVGGLILLLGVTLNGVVAGRIESA